VSGSRSTRAFFLLGDRWTGTVSILGPEIVRQGYNAVSDLYRADGETPAAYVEWFAELTARVRAGSAVLDLGCGCGVPLARDLSNAGYAVTGVDISDVQIQRARLLVPDATFLRDDFTRVQFTAASFDAVVCLYAIIHVPLDRQPLVLTHIARWLRPGGWLLLAAGEDAWTGSEEGWLGSASAMWWSQEDAATYRQWIVDAGLAVVEQRFIPEGLSGHSLFWARQRLR
jgi:2-polyprenyl-3-methyl-5-hydroxy-6-metoxy-1,4-benzoquinol methylase